MESEGKYTLELAAEPDNDALTQLLGRMEGVDSVEREGELLIVRSREDLRRKATLTLAANGYTLLQLRQKGGIWMKSTAGILKRPKKSMRPGKLLERVSRGLDAVFAGNEDNIRGLHALYQKEMMDHIRSKKFLMILILVCVTS